MKKELALIGLLLVLVVLAYAQPMPPFPVQFPGSDSDTTPDTSTPSTAPSQTEPAAAVPDTQPAAQPETVPQETPASSAQLETPSSGFSVFYIILIIILILAIVSFGVYWFFKHKTRKIVTVPDNVKMYVRANLQRGYSEAQLRQQLAVQGWTLEQINQIFTEVHHGF